MAGIETGTEAVERLAKANEMIVGRTTAPTLASSNAATLRALAAERDTLAEQLNAALADAVTLAHRLTSAEGERDALVKANSVTIGTSEIERAERDVERAAGMTASDWQRLYQGIL